MTRKLTRSYSPIVIAAAVAILNLLIAAAVLAQTSGAGQPTGKANAVLAPAGTSASAQAQRPLSPWTGAGSSPVSRPQTKRHGARPMDAGPLIFLPAVTYGAGADESYSVAVADVNDDGKPDLVLADFTSSSVSVLLGNGDGTFQTAVLYGSGGYGPTSVAVADVNGDGKPDIVVTNYDGPTVGVLLGNGDGTFEAAVAYGAGGSPNSVAVADVNGDGKLDLLVANMEGNVGVLLGNGDGTFQPAATFGSGGTAATSVSVADVNRDGRPDVLAANYFSSSVGVLLGNGDGTFQPALAYSPGGSGPYSVAVADVNGDGKPDVLVANYFSVSVGVLLGNGDGTFQSAVTYNTGALGPIGPISVAVADANGDGKPDLLVVNIFADWPDDESGTVGLLLGNGDGTFQAAVTYNSGGSFGESVAVADLNADGKPDLVVANGSASVGVLLNNIGAPATTTSLVSSANPIDIKQVVTYTATVAGQSGGTVSGSVTFEDGTRVVATVTLANNQAAYTTSYKAKQAGLHPITAAYGGVFRVAEGSQSATLAEYVRDAKSKTVATTSGSPSHVGQPVTFTATVTSAQGSIPDGELVTFYDGKILLGTSAIASGAATYTTSSLSAKKHIIKATYPGDATFEPSKGSVKQVVEN
jgi:hypothetical protein